MTLATLCFPGGLEARPDTAGSLGATPGSAPCPRRRSPALHLWAPNPVERADSAFVLPWQSFLLLKLGWGRRAGGRGSVTPAQGPQAVELPLQRGKPRGPTSRCSLRGPLCKCFDSRSEAPFSHLNNPALSRSLGQNRQLIVNSAGWVIFTRLNCKSSSVYI